MSSTIGILVTIDRQACVRVEVTTPTQLEITLEDMEWDRTLWPTSGGTNARKAKTKKIWRHLNTYVPQHIPECVLKPPGGESLPREPPEMSHLVTLVYAVALPRPEMAADQRSF